MGRRNLISIVAPVLATLVGYGARAEAALFTDCQLVVDGSSEPPGDRIDVEVGLLDGDRNVEVVVRAYVVGGDEAAGPTPLPSRDPALRDEAGLLVVRKTIARVGEARGARTSFAIPYAAMGLADGEHRIAYEATLLIEGRAVAAHPLPATVVVIGDRTRTELRARPLVRPTERFDSPRRVALGDAAADGGVENRSVRLELRPGPEESNGRVAARVERGFERPVVAGRSPHDERLADLGDQPWSPADRELSERQRTVRFVTNRASSTADAGESGPTFLPLRGAVRYGVCRVNFPVRYHVRGRLERPAWWQSFDPERHFRVDSTTFATLGDLLADVRRDDALLFVHGFANSFDDGVMTTAQLAADVGFGGRAIAFCWPSSGELSEEAYLRDAAAAKESVDDLADFLAAASEAAGPGRVHVIAHSMGNKILLEAVYRLVDSGRWGSEEKRLGQVVLAAPDVGAATFNNLVDNVLTTAQRVTYYYYDDDVALGVSQQVNNYEPVGKYPYFERGLDTINVDGSGTDFLGHSYYSSSVKILADLQLLLQFGYSPDRRMPPLGAKTRVYGHDHWSFLPLEASTAAGEE